MTAEGTWLVEGGGVDVPKREMVKGLPLAPVNETLMVAERFPTSESSGTKEAPTAQVLVGGVFGSVPVQVPFVAAKSAGFAPPLMLAEIAEMLPVELLVITQESGLSLLAPEPATVLAKV